MKKKKLKIVILLLIIVILLLLIILNLVKKDSEINKKTNEQVIVVRGLENKYPTNTFYLSQKYQGDMEMNKISTIVSRFMTSSIPTLRASIENDMTDNELLEYYNKNTQIIKKLYGSITSDEFIKIAKLIQKLKKKELIYENSEYFVDTIEEDDNLFKVTLRIQYEGEEYIDVIVKINEVYNKITFLAK